jgi:hypothetical protein
MMKKRRKKRKLRKRSKMVNKSTSRDVFFNERGV